MACYHPQYAWQYPRLKPNGKTHISFGIPSFIPNNIAKSIILPCNKCIGCRLQQSREWAIRITHEASLYPSNSFITLTYDDAHLPKDKSLNPEHFTLFMKRLRQQYPQHIRFYACGEYGEQLKRPHYHACIFNLDFSSDREPFSPASQQLKNKLFTSKILSNTWNQGFVTIGDLTFQSAAYVARYVTKKINGDPAKKHYQGRKAEFSRMSRMPGLGHDWFQKYHTDLYPDDFALMNGRKYPVPRYYDKILELTDPDLYAQIKASREAAGGSHPEDETPDRLLTREIVQQLKADRLKRSIEKDDFDGT